MWPLASPDLNPTDVLVWSMLKENISCVVYPSVDALKTCLLTERAKIPQKTQCASVDSFTKRIKLLIEKKVIT